MIEPTDIEGKIAEQINALESESGRLAFVWQMHKHRGIEYLPPLFRGQECPDLPQIAMPRIEGIADYACAAARAAEVVKFPSKREKRGAPEGAPKSAWRLRGLPWLNALAGYGSILVHFPGVRTRLDTPT